MALNSSHAGKGVLIYSGECIILFSDHVTMEFSGSLPEPMKGSKTGRLYLTTHRIIFNNKDNKNSMQSFSSPFYLLTKVELEQPVFGANYISGLVTAQVNGGFSGQAKFKLTFKHGGAIEFGQALLKVASMASRNTTQSFRENPPPYTAPSANYYAPPPPAYAPPQGGYYGWAPPTNVFPERPPTDGVFMYEAPPPYPGVNTPTSYPGAAASAPTMMNGSAADAKAQEAAQAASAYYNPQKPDYAYVPPPSYGFQMESPPSYTDATTKKSQ